MPPIQVRRLALAGSSLTTQFDEATSLGLSLGVICCFCRALS
jgi:hypothetical protein